MRRSSKDEGRSHDFSDREAVLEEATKIAPLSGEDSGFALHCVPDSDGSLRTRVFAPMTVSLYRRLFRRETRLFFRGLRQTRPVRPE